MKDLEELRLRLMRDAGRRYADASFRSFSIGNDKFTARRKDALQQAVSYFRSGETTILKGKNLVLYGTIGTGKDHLAVAVAKACCACGLSARFVTGQAIVESGDRSRRYGPDVVDQGVRTCRVLVLSDPLPNAADLSDSETRHLLHLVDHRYRNLLPTIVTANACSREELMEFLRGPLGDRLLSGSTVVEMRWPSHRDSQNSRQ